LTHFHSPTFTCHFITADAAGNVDFTARLLFGVCGWSRKTSHRSAPWTFFFPTPCTYGDEGRGAPGAILDPFSSSFPDSGGGGRGRAGNDPPLRLAGVPTASQESLEFWVRAVAVDGVCGSTREVGDPARG